METKAYDVIVIGAGAAGLMAAWELALTGRRVAVVEAKDRTGGRMHTISSSGFEKPVELGAEFVHGKLPVTLSLMEKAGIKKLPAEGEVWESKGGKLQEAEDFIPDYKKLLKELNALQKDVPIAEFLATRLDGAQNNDLRLSVGRYAEGYYAADLTKASSFALREELTKGEDVNYRVNGGYRGLVNYLERECRTKDAAFFLGEEVLSVEWKKDAVAVRTASSTYSAERLVVTVSLGVWQAEKIAFAPALLEKISLIQQLGFGHVLKVNLQFREAFWKEEAFTGGRDTSNAGFFFSDQPVPTWWTQHPLEEKVLVGWHGGPSAQRYSTKSKEEVVTEALQSLAGVFGKAPSVVKELLVASEWYNWSDDPHVCGAYSYNVVNGENLIPQAAQPVERTLYFAGEGFVWGNNSGTVEAALQSGREAAQRLIADMRYG